MTDNATSHIPAIATENLRLRAHRRADFEQYAAMWRQEDSRYMGGPLSRQQAWLAFCDDCAGWVLDGHGCWAIDTNDGTFVGQVGIKQPDHFPEPELGWVIFTDHRGNGHAHEAAAAALDFARDTLNRTTLVSYIDPENTASIRLATRLGALPDPDAALPRGETPQQTTVYRHRLSA